MMGNYYSVAGRFATAIPSNWKIAETVPIYKKGSTAELNNYRPISMTSVTCKLMESIIRDHLLNYFLRNKFLVTVWFH